MGLVMGFNWICEFWVWFMGWWSADWFLGRLIRGIEKGMMGDLGPWNWEMWGLAFVESLGGRYLVSRALEDHDALRGRDGEMDRHELQFSPRLQY